MILYAESSAILSWLLNEPQGRQIGSALQSAARVVASTLTGIECARAIVRGATLRQLTRPQAVALIGTLRSLESQWDRIELGERVARMSAEPFPAEPIRALDAIHVASAAIADDAFGPVTMASFDERVRENARLLGLPLLPA